MSVRPSFEPVLEVVAEVVAAERQHRERIAAHDADLADDRGGRLGGHRRRHVDAVRPVVRFGHQRHGRRAASAEEERADRHAGGIVPVRVERRDLVRGDGEARVRMRGGLAAAGRPAVALPVDEIRGRLFGEPFPPHVAVGRHRDVGEDRVLVAAPRGSSGFVSADVPGATPKAPASGLIA